MKLVPFNGTMVAPIWPEQHRIAQTQPYTSRNGQTFERIRLGDESRDMAYMADQDPCHDCATLPGQYHVPGCDSEECPSCGGQAFCCDCEVVQ